MHGSTNGKSPSVKLRPGDLVEVRSWSEIAGTLDAKGTLENMPFMPEMLAFCGRQYRVSRRAFKTCVDDADMRELDNTVFLEDLRCDGKSHGGCAKSCLIFWKEAWLKPAGSTEAASSLRCDGVTQEELMALAGSEGDFFCQSTEIINASAPLPWWHAKQYLWDLSRNRVSPSKWFKSLFIVFYNKIAHVSGLKSWGFVAGPGTSNGSLPPLNLNNGDLVRVKTLREIQTTLDASGKNQHLFFAPAMAEFCGQVMRVRNRVDRIILEGTPRQREIKNTVLLEGAVCDGVCHRMCPRQSLLFWRECWLEKVNSSESVAR